MAQQSPEQQPSLRDVAEALQAADDQRTRVAMHVERAYSMFAREQAAARGQVVSLDRLKVQLREAQVMAEEAVAASKRARDLCGRRAGLEREAEVETARMRGLNAYRDALNATDENLISLRQTCRVLEERFPEQKQAILEDWRLRQVAGASVERLMKVVPPAHGDWQPGDEYVLECSEVETSATMVNIATSHRPELLVQDACVERMTPEQKQLSAVWQTELARRAGEPVRIVDSDASGVPLMPPYAPTAHLQGLADPARCGSLAASQFSGQQVETLLANVQPASSDVEGVQR